jgi:1-aminocyclopropane-1-carboxylate deaminase/D-cysteine desulfhydrase-like pyridoxal-dependent ACC family enzyme
VSGSGEVALLQLLPRLRAPWLRLGDWPTPVEPLPRIAADLWVKRDDLSAGAYGGNKVRTLEALFGEAQEQGARRMWAVGAVGSNHALATVLHAPTAGMEAGVMLFPQPPSGCARENLRAMLSRRPALRPLWSWASVPWAIWRARRAPGSFVMVPGGATPFGALGYVSAALELAQQVAAGALPEPRAIVVGVGSTCTSAGLLAGTAIAARLGIGFRAQPTIVAVRVTPWPVTAAVRVVSLAGRAARLLADLAGDGRLALEKRDLTPRLTVLGGFLGRGYGYVTESGQAAIETFRAGGGPPLDTCYSGKAAAGLLARRGEGPVVFWATKSSRPLPPDDAAAPVPKAWARWLARE